MHGTERLQCLQYLGGQTEKALSVKRLSATFGVPGAEARDRGFVEAVPRFEHPHRR